MNEEILSMQTLDDFIKHLRKKHHPEFVPDFDPNDGGENARMLFLFEKPGPMTDSKNGGSGFISQDNNDKTAEATKKFLRKAGICRKDIVLWNCISAWNGTREITPKEKKEVKTEILQLLKILKKVSSIVFVGNEAKRHYKHLDKHLDSHGYEVTFSNHPSPLVFAAHKKKWSKIPKIWALATPIKQVKLFHRYGLCQIARLINIRALMQRHKIRQNLRRNRKQNRRNQ